LLFKSIRYLWRGAFLALCLAIFLPPIGRAQDKPYFVTYSHDLEEPGNLEIETKTALARPGGGNQFGATAMELEYGTRAWWTTELYLDGQATGSDSAVFTGWRLENRVRPLMRDHAVNPVFYVKYENTAGALVFREHCQQCHQANAQGDGHKRPSLRSEGIRTASDGDIEWFLRRATCAMACPPGRACPRPSAGRLLPI
jgi:hypothetical protein